MGKLKKFKGTNREYIELHQWIKKRKPKTECCEWCKKTKIIWFEQKKTCRRGFTKKIDLELANISGEYHRDVTDFAWLCHDCHMKYDGNFDKCIDKKNYCKRFNFGICNYYKEKCNVKFQDCWIFNMEREVIQ